MRRSALWAVLGLAIAWPVRAQTEAEPPSVYALRNARIVVAPGRVIEQGTIVIRDGRIAAVGANVEVPVGAVPLDLAGRTIYAGLIDPATTVGVPPVSARQGGGPPQGPPGNFQQARTASASRDEVPSEMRADRSAGSEFAPSAADLEALRSQGITAVGLVFDTGLLPGQVAAALVGDGSPETMVLRSPVAQQIVFGRRRGGYPGTLMGALAYVRQAYYDAQHAAQVEAAFARNPGSAPRPVFDARNEALQASLDGEIPAWIEASALREFPRAAEVATDVGIDRWAILGAQEAYKSLDILKGLGVPLIVSLDWPEPDAVTGRAFELHVAPVSGPDSAALRADSAVARELRGNAAQVAAAGIPFALTGHGLSNPSQYRDRLVATVEAGLSSDEALRAATVRPAEMLGLGGLLGTVEAGKLANLVVVEGDLFAKEGRIRHVFVEGRRFDIEETARPTGRQAARPAAGAAVNAAGDWAGSIEMAGSTMPITLTLSADGTTLTGTLSSEVGATPVTGEIDGSAVTLAGEFAPPGMNAMTLTITGTIANNELTGTLSVQGQAPVPFTVRRTSPGAAATDGGIQ